MSERERLHFTFDGRPVPAQPGQSIAAALLAAGTTVLTRSSKYRRPRGIHCAKGACANCMLRVDGRPHVRACMVEVRDGMEVISEGATTRKVDVFRAIDHAGQLFPVGFQYRYFKRQNVAWRLWERQLRKLAAETRMPDAVDVVPARRITVDLLVVGSGPAGLAAARSAAESGLEVAIVARRARLAGQLGSVPGVVEDIRWVLDSALVRILAPATVIAGFGDQYVVDAGDTAIEVTARTSVLATGAWERSVSFPGNDRPGVMLTSALHRLLTQERVLGDATAVLVIEEDTGYDQATELLAAGLRLAAIVDVRTTAAAAGVAQQLPVEVVPAADVTGVQGRSSITGVALNVGGEHRVIACDVVGMSGGWQRADELRYSATSTGEALVLGERAVPLDPFDWERTPMPVLQGVGAVVGTMNLKDAVAEGEVAGLWAAVSLQKVDRDLMNQTVAAFAARTGEVGPNG